MACPPTSLLSPPWRYCGIAAARRLYIGNMTDLTYTAFMVALSVAFNHQQTSIVPRGFLS